MKTSWRNRGEKISNDAALLGMIRENIINPNKIPPWNTNSCFVTKTTLSRNYKKSEPPHVLKQLALETMSNLPRTNITIWTDGSATGGTTNAGSGVYIQYNGQEAVIRKPAGRIAPSYKAELIATKEALVWLNQKNIADQNITLLSDSKSALEKLEQGQRKLNSVTELEIRENATTLKERNVKVLMQWVPGHVGLYGNEKVDTEAKKACELQQENVPVDVSTATAVIRRHCKEKWKKSLDHKTLTSNLMRNGPNNTMEIGLSRRERIVMSQIRTGEHCPLFRAYLFRIGTTREAKCRKIGPMS